MDDCDRASKARSSFSRVPEHAPVVRGRAFKSGPCISISLVLWPITQFASLSLVVGFLKQEVQLA